MQLNVFLRICFSFWIIWKNLNIHVNRFFPTYWLFQKSSSILESMRWILWVSANIIITFIVRTSPVWSPCLWTPVRTSIWKRVSLILIRGSVNRLLWFSEFSASQLEKQHYSRPQLSLYLIWTKLLTLLRRLLNCFQLALLDVVT